MHSSQLGTLQTHMANKACTGREACLVVLLRLRQQSGIHVDVKLLAVRLFVAACQEAAADVLSHHCNGVAAIQVQTIQDSVQ